MFEQQYRQRLDQDLTRWEAGGVVAPGTHAAIRTALGPAPRGVDLTTAVAIVGGLLIAAAFLAFVAANWEVIARPARFGILLAGIVGAFGLGAIFARKGWTVLADLSAAVGSIIFGAAIALTGQMYHLGDDFSGGMMLWALGALIAAALTGSRGALAVALAAGSVWSGGRAFEGDVPHLAFIPFCLAGAALSIAWKATAARHLVGVAAVAWWGCTAFAMVDGLGGYRDYNVAFTLAAGFSLLLGTGLAMTIVPRMQAFGATQTAYAAFAFVLAVAMAITGAPGANVAPALGWEMICGLAGVGAALLAGLITRRAGTAFAGMSLVLGLTAIAIYARPTALEEPWLSYALSLASMLGMVISGMLDEHRPRVVAGWIGLASVIAVITWAVKGSLLRRALFLAIAGGAAIALAIGLGRLMPKRETA